MRIYFIVKIECEDDWWYVHAHGERIRSDKTARRMVKQDAELAARQINENNPNMTATIHRRIKS